MQVRHVVRGIAVGIALGLAAFLLAAAARAGDYERGRLLYQARCVGCHEVSVHNRAARVAITIEALRAQGRRWDGVMGGAWQDSEVNDVTTYLNELYYGYPCTPEICPERKAAAPHERAAAARQR